MIPLMMQRDYSPKGWRESQHQASVLIYSAIVMFGNDFAAGSGVDDGHSALVRRPLCC